MPQLQQEINMPLAVVGETCAITFDTFDHRAYEFTLTKSGSRVSVKAFVDGVGVNPEITTGVGTELACKFRDDITEVFVINTVYEIEYTIGTSAAVKADYKCLSIESPNPAEGISDFSATFKQEAAAPVS
jgi:hypothetical protein